LTGRGGRDIHKTFRLRYYAFTSFPVPENELPKTRAEITRIKMKLAYILFVVAITSPVITAHVTNEAALAGNQRTPVQLYSKHCASCHGKDGRAQTFKAKFNHARDLTDPRWQDEVSDERLFNSIMNGKKKMPSFRKKLSEAEINSLIAYVRTLAR
jgi:mono/diheme cytochrome c family protein